MYSKVILGQNFLISVIFKVFKDKISGFLYIIEFGNDMNFSGLWLGV